MKIINKDDCYVQKSDFEYILDTCNNIPNEVFREYVVSLNNPNDFVKINNKVASEYIILSSIPSFEELNNYSISKIDELIFKIKLSIFDSIDNSEEELNSIKEEIKRKDYILKQLLEILKYKYKKSNLNYPNVPLDNKSVSNGVYEAYKSINSGKVLIEIPEDTNLSELENDEFCTVAYNLLMHDEREKNVELNMFYDNGYLVIENVKNKIKKLKYKSSL